MHRRLVLGAIALGALAVGSLVAPAEAAGKFRVVETNNTTVASPPVTGPPSCNDAGNNCVLSYTVSTQVSGNLQGTLSEDGLLYSKAGESTLQFSAMGIFTGTLKGCGSGSFALYLPLTTLDPAAPLTAHSMLVPGSGAGGLAGISQVGPWTYTFDPSGKGTSSGRARCQVG
jgi:Protein of unknown function (DUF3224)